MQKSSNFLLQLRMDSKRTRAELAADLTAIIGREGYERTEKHIIKFEKNFNSLTPMDIKAYNMVFGIDLLEEMLSGGSAPKKKLFEISESPSQEREKYLAPILKILNKVQDHEKVQNLSNNLKVAKLKPTVALFGGFDAGKSTLLNYLLEKEIQKISFGPTTSFNLLVCHKEDRPKWWENDEFHLYEPDFNPTNRHISEYAQKYLRTSGPSSVLQELTYKNEDSHNTEDCFGILYVDSDILKLCNFIDTPGYDSDKISDLSQTERLLKQARKQSLFDVAFLLSPCNGFLKGSDLQYANWIVNNLAIERDGDSFKNLENFFIIATHVNSSFDKWKDELHSNCKRLTISTSPMLDIDAADKDLVNSVTQHFVKRVIPFSPTVSKYQGNFLEELHKLLDSKIEASQVGLKKNLKSQVRKLKKQLQKEIKHAGEIKNINLENDPFLIEKYDEIISLIDKSRKEFGTFVNQRIKSYNKERIYQIIATVFDNDSKTANRDLPPYLQGLIEKELNNEILKKMKKINAKIDELIGEISIKVNFVKVGIKDTAEDGFDGKSAFFSGLAGLATFGGLGLWASSLGPLGSYILVAKGVSTFAAMGIMTGGTASAIATVSALGGPVTLAIGLGVLAWAAARKFLSEDWRTRLANRLIKGLEEADYEEQYDKFWLETNNAFITAYSELKIAAARYVTDVRDVQILKKNLEHLEQVEDYLD